MADTDGPNRSGSSGWAHPSGDAPPPIVFSPVPLPPEPPLAPVPPPFQSAPPPPFQSAPPPPFQSAPGARPGGPWALNVTGLLATKPGIIPLRPLSMGEVFDASIKALRFNPPVMLGFSALVMFLVAGVQSLAFWQYGTTASFATGLNTGAGSTESLEEFNSALGNMLLLGLVVSVVGGFLQLVLVAVGTVAVAKAVLGTKVSLGDAWRAVRRRLWRLFLTSLLLGLIFLVAIIATSVVAGLFAVVTLGIGLILAYPAMGLALIWLWSRLFAAIPIVLLEDTGPGAAIGRAWRLSGPRAWPLVGVWTLTSIILSIFNMVFSIPIYIVMFSVPDVGTSWLFPVTLFASTFLSALIIAPIMTAVSALLYTDLRMRHEGFDIQLAQLSTAGGR